MCLIQAEKAADWPNTWQLASGESTKITIEAKSEMHVEPAPSALHVHQAEPLLRKQASLWCTASSV